MQVGGIPIESWVRLAAQRALLDEVPPRLRSVSFDLGEGERLRGRFEFDGNPTEEERECASVVMTNMIADLSATFSFSEEFVSNPYPQRRNFLSIAVYARNEDAFNSWTSGYGKDETPNDQT